MCIRDSNGCLNYMNGNKNSFDSLDKNIKSHITLGDGSHQDVASKGTIAIKAKNDSMKFIQDMSLASSKSIKCGSIAPKRLYSEI